MCALDMLSSSKLTKSCAATSQLELHSQILEELLEQLAGKAAVKEALQTLVPPNAPAQMPQALAIPIKGVP